MFGFLIGAIAGSMATYYWRRQIADYLNTRVPSFRDRAADTLGTVGDRARTVLDRAKDQIETTVRSGQERLRPTGTTGAAPRPTGPAGMAGGVVTDTERQSRTPSRSESNRPGI